MERVKGVPLYKYFDTANDDEKEKIINDMLTMLDELHHSQVQLLITIRTVRFFINGNIHWP